MLIVVLEMVTNCLFGETKNMLEAAENFSLLIVFSTYLVNA